MLLWVSLGPVLLLWIVLSLIIRFRQSLLVTTVAGMKEALFVFAHPDDETMFFTPTILLLHKNSVKVHLLCLSDGDFDGLGKTRGKEFDKVSAALGVFRHEIVNDKDLRDGPQIWPIDAVGRAVSDYMSRNPRIGAVFTFDEHGVSGHPNHVSVYRGVVDLKKNGTITSSVYFLRSVNILRKYIPPLDILLSLFDSPILAVNTQDPLLSLRIMRLYHSQNVWFRKLFSVFSRYSYVNDYISS